jgi:hypothetical protein
MAKGRMKRRGLALAILVAVAVALTLTFNCVTEGQRAQIASLEDSIKGLKDSQLLARFVIESKQDGLIRFTLRLYDAEGREVNETKPKVDYPTSLKGGELMLSFRVFSLKDGKTRLFFPDRVFTDEIAPDSGVSLVPYYDLGGIPAIYRSDSMGQESLEAIFRRSGIFDRVKSGAFEGSEYGSFVHDMKSLSEFKTGIPYKVVAHTRGGIEALEFQKEM